MNIEICDYKINPIIWESFVSQMSLAKHILKSNPKILIAVSGGPDSMFLTYLIHKYSQIFTLEPIVCYINHNIRPKQEIEKEILLIKNFTSTLKIPFITAKINKSKKTDENTLRNERYKKLLTIAKKSGCSIILTGHTKNDVVETFLFNLFRGTGIKGLSGISSFREIVFEEKIFYLLRPLIRISKEDILDILAKLKIKFSVDKTNLKSVYSRNFIRNVILKKVKKFFCKYDNNIINTVDLLSEVQNYISFQTDVALKKVVKIINNQNIYLDFRNFLMYNSLIQKEVLHRILDFLLTRNRVSFKSSYSKIINKLLHFFNTKNTIFEINKKLIVKKQKTNIVFKITK
ncbi:MAG: tRNA lysidine(34) synthetase TilS [Endomicrobiia bacterium]